MSICLFIQARINSKRLPGKVLFKIKDKPILEHIVKRVAKSEFNIKIVVLTSTKKKDDKIVNFCKKKKFKYFRGPLDNVYERYLKAIKKYRCHAFIRINADSPLTDPSIIDIIIKKYKKLKTYDIVTNCMVRTFSKGLSVEMIKSKTFLENYKKIKKNYNKEHITSYFYARKKKFKIFNISTKKKFTMKKYSVDTLNDFLKIKKYINENN